MVVPRQRQLAPSGLRLIMRLLEALAQLLRLLAAAELRQSHQGLLLLVAVVESRAITLPGLEAILPPYPRRLTALSLMLQEGVEVTLEMEEMGQTATRSAQ